MPRRMEQRKISSSGEGVERNGRGERGGECERELEWKGGGNTITERDRRNEEDIEIERERERIAMLW